MTARRLITPLGHFIVYRPDDAVCIEAWHLPSNLRACTFSHLTYRTLKSAHAAMTDAENAAASTLKKLRHSHAPYDPDDLAIVRHAIRQHIANAL